MCRLETEIFLGEGIVCTCVLHYIQCCCLYVCLCMFFMFVYVLVELMLHSFTDLGMLCMTLPILAMPIQDERTGGLLVVLLAWQLFPTWRAPHTTTYSIYIYLQQHCPCCRARLDHNNSTSLSLSVTMFLCFLLHCCKSINCVL